MIPFDRRFSIHSVCLYVLTAIDLGGVKVSPFDWRLLIVGEWLFDPGSERRIHLIGIVGQAVLGRIWHDDIDDRES